MTETGDLRLETKDKETTNPDKKKAPEGALQSPVASLQSLCARNDRVGDRPRLRSDGRLRGRAETIRQRQRHGVRRRDSGDQVGARRRERDVVMARSAVGRRERDLE